MVIISCWWQFKVIVWWCQFMVIISQFRQSHCLLSSVFVSKSVGRQCSYFGLSSYIQFILYIVPLAFPLWARSTVVIWLIFVSFYLKRGRKRIKLFTTLFMIFHFEIITLPKDADSVTAVQTRVVPHIVHNVCSYTDTQRWWVGCGLESLGMELEMSIFCGFWRGE